MSCNLVKYLPSKTLKLLVAKFFYGLGKVFYMLLKPLGVTENEITTIKQYSFQDLLFSNILSAKTDYFSRKFFENKVGNSIRKTELTNATSDYYTFLTTIFQEW